MDFFRVFKRFARPGNTTAYATGDLVSSDVDAADSDDYLTFDLTPLRGNPCKLLSGQLKKSTSTATAAVFTLHLFDRMKTPSQGDNGANVHFGDADGWLCSMSFDLSTGATAVFNGPLAKAAAALANPIVIPEVSTLYGYIVAGGNYAPGNAEVFQVALDLEV